MNAFTFTLIWLALLLPVEEAPDGLFTPELAVDDRPLVLNGTGLCEWGFFAVDLYWAALYLESRSSDPERIIKSDQVMKIHLHFVRALTRDQLREAYRAAFKVNAGDKLKLYQKRLDRLTDMMADVNEGDSLVFTFIPGQGLKVTVKGKDRGGIAGDDFGRMFMTLYLGKHCPDEDLRAGLLGGKE
jgi:hypothetical protein